MTVNSPSFAPWPARRSLIFPLFGRRGPRTIGPFCTRSRGPLTGAQNVGAVLQPTYEQVARKRQMQNPPMFLPSKTTVVSSHSGYPFQPPYRRHNPLWFPPFPHAIYSRIRKPLVSLGNTCIVHMRTPRTCTPPFIRRGRAGRFVACHSASAALPGPFRRESRFRHLPITSVR